MRLWWENMLGWFRVGRMPKALRAEMESQGGFLFLAEGIGATAVFRNFKAPGVRSNSRIMKFHGYLAMTDRMLILCARLFHRIDIQIAYDDPRFQAILFRITEKHLILTFDPSLFLADSSGEVEVRLCLPDSMQAARLLREKGAFVNIKEEVS